jgi:galactokinase
MSTHIQVLKTFAANFKSDPFLYFSPGRINLIGEHIDYNDGYVLPAAIDKGLWFAVAPNYTETINIISADLNERFSIEVGPVNKSSGWKNYILGVLHVLQKSRLPFNGFDCVFGGNLPQGAGLSSSAAVECGLLFAINDIFQLGMLKPTMALLAQQAEHAFPEVKCGVMDQFANLMGKKDHVILLDCKTLEHEYLPFSLSQYSIVLINSKVTHSLASGEYNIRRRQCWQGLSEIQKMDESIQTFRDIDSGYIETNNTLFSNEVYKRCLYVTDEMRRTQQAKIFLQQGNIEAFGQLMYATHNGLSTLYDVSCAELDFLVQQAAAAQVVGSRLMGGGFGGCTINILRKENASAVIGSILSAYQKKFDITAEVIEVALGDGTHEIEL